MSVDEEKSIEYYAAKANAWFNTKLEYDKSKLVLSAGAVGLLITLLTTIGVTTVAQLILFISALISFIICIISVLIIFTRNAKHLEDLIEGKKENDTMLQFLDFVSIFTFIFGIILATIIGISIATVNVFIKETEMTEKKETKKTIVEIQKSFNGANKIAPHDTDSLTASFNGAQKIAPLAPVQENIPLSTTDKVTIPKPVEQTQNTDKENKE